MPLPSLLIISFLSGSLMKLTDDIMDRDLPVSSLFTILPGLAYGLLIGYLMTTDTNAAILFGGIVLGCLVTGKINGTGHYFGLAAILIVLFLYGIKLSPLVFLTASLAALDEMGSRVLVVRLRFIFDYRLIMKLGILILVFFDLLGLNALIILLAFDLAYILAERIGRRFLHEI